MEVPAVAVHQRHLGVLCGGLGVLELQYAQTGQRRLVPLVHWWHDFVVDAYLARRPRIAAPQDPR